MDETQELTEPVSLLLSSRNFFVLVIVFQFILIINGEYLYGISTTAAIIYMLVPAALMVYMISMTKLSNGKPISWEMLEGSMKGRKDPLSDYLRKAGWSVSYFSLGVQLTYLLLGFMLAFVSLLFIVMQGWLEVGSVDAIQARSAIVYTLILVAPAESIIFVGIIPLWLSLTFAKSSKRIYIIYIVSQAIFAIFHFAAYGGMMASLAFAFFMGIVFLWTARTYGIPAVIGVHAAWNLVIIGIGSPMIGA